jgi:hypothetical protein
MTSRSVLKGWFAVSWWRFDVRFDHQWIFSIGRGGVTARAVALAGSFVCVSALAADDPVSIVRSLRAESNAAIAAHDATRLRPLFDKDYYGIQGTSGALDSGGEATARSYGAEEFQDATFISYVRNPDTVEIARSGRRIGEYGHWVGTWRKADGTMRKRGKYLAVWTVSDGKWRLKSETFVTLSCVGSAECQGGG